MKPNAPILFVENRDSFSWNVVEALPAPREAVIWSSTEDFIRRPPSLGSYRAVVVGPGPQDPLRTRLVEAVRAVVEEGIPLLGICLGHQALGLAYGAQLVRTAPCHGKTSDVSFVEHPRLPGVLGTQAVMRYHSLSLQNVQSPLQVVARTSDGIPMAVAHETKHAIGFQFHPDSYGTDSGPQMVAAFFEGLA